MAAARRRLTSAPLWTTLAHDTGGRPCRSAERRSSSPAPAAASAWPSRCAPRATAPTSPSPPRPPSRTRSCPAPSTRRPRRSSRPAARRCRWSSTSATRSRCRRRSRRPSATFGGIDICVNNASAIQLTGTLATDMKRYDLMHQVNTRGTFLVLAGLHPAPAEGGQPARPEPLAAARHEPALVRAHVAYTMAKFGMSMCVLGMAEEFRGDGVAVNALWPRTAIATAAMRNAARRRRHGRRSAARRRSWPTPPTRSSPSRRASSPATSSSTRRCCAPKASPTSRSTPRARRDAAAGRFLRAGRGVRSLADADQARVLTLRQTSPGTFDRVAVGLPARHRITSSARISSDCGIVSPSALAVLRLIARLNRVVCSMARSPGLAPFKIWLM